MSYRSSIEVVGNNTDPDIVYYNADIVADAFDPSSLGLDRDPPIRFQETRSTPLINDISKYMFSIIRFTMDGAGKDLPIADLGNSDHVQVGDWAIAVGNPLGFDNTVTLGIVSTLKRSSAQVGISDKRLDFIQTDAAINPGNSGGPLLNGLGEVIGINTAIRADAMGIGFAIPIDKAKVIAAQLQRDGKVAHPYLGVQMVTLTPELAKQNNNDPNSMFAIPEVAGVLVMRVVPNSPAATAGIRRGDVILQINNNPITSAEQLQGVVEDSTLGQALQVKVQRGNQTQMLSVRTAELKDIS
jgi:S1-C subfamily serine protease